MKYYILSEKEKKRAAAIVFSDSFKEDFYIRSRVESLSIIFDAIRKRDSIKLVKADKSVVAKLNDTIRSVDAQVEAILDEICSSTRWVLGDIGETDFPDSVLKLNLS